jgi:phosphoesterase RecJ-like protein
MLAELFQEIPEWKNERSSRFCFVAIASDTNFFRYANTTSKTLHTAADLDQNPSEIDQILFPKCYFDRHDLNGMVLQRTSLENDILFTWIAAEEFHVLQVNEKSSEILEHLQKIQGEHLILLFKEVADERWRVSLRQKGSRS